MSLGRFFGVLFGILGAVLLSLVLYITFGDLSRHKGRIEALVTQSVGRPFAIDGPFKLKIIPVVDVSAERVRLGNAPGGSQPQMVEVGKAAVQIGLWSLISGPPDVRSFELSDATLLLEQGPDGKGNWVMGSPKPDEENESESETDTDAVHVPVVIRSAQLSNVRLIYREAKKPDRVVQLDKLSITPGKEDLLALDGEGKVDAYPLALNGEVGPLKSLLSARDMRMAMQVSLGKMALDVKGVIGTLDPLDGADLTLKVEHPELGGMLEKLNLPVVASGPLQIETRLKDAGALTQLNFNAKVGDIEASAKGTLKALSLVGSDLKLEVTAADAARLAKVFDVTGVPAAPLTVTGHTVHSRKEIKFDALTATLADASVRADGSMRLTRDRKTALRFKLAAASLAKLRDTLPEMKVSASGAFESVKDRLELKDLQATLGKTQLAGSLLLSGGAKHIEAQLSSPRLDLTPFFPQEKPTDAAATGTTSATKKTPPKTEKTEPKNKYVFSETPLPLKKMKDTDAKLHLACGELVLGDRSIKNLDGNLHVDHGKIAFDMRAAGTHEGTLQGVGTFAAADDGTANLDLKIDIDKLRANLGSEGLAPADVPPLSVAVNIKIHGSSPRQMASGANGQLLLTQGAGRTKSGVIAAYGGGVLGQLAQKLNPFAKDDPFMKLDCTIARADIVNGQVTVKPMLLQTEKVTITAHGTIDLHTEKLLLDFNTRPREGIGVSPGMFTNPFIQLQGTLASPTVGVGAKGVASGAVAAATGGVSVVAGGMVDRAQGEKDLCGKTLAEASQPAETTKAAAL
ncbi:MAG: AsmA family protein [Povalibacter sp.]